jgi:gamma-glutamyltranspeptidase/glutathione hydrolase
MARGGIVTSPHRLASEAGLDILRRGGNAIEASIAISAVLAVTYPHFCGIGGDAVWLVAAPNRPPTSFLGIGPAIAAVPRGAAIPVRGAGSVLTTACLVDSWRHALAFSEREWEGRLRLADLLEPAIHHAEAGFPLSPSQAFWLDFRRGEFAGWPGFSAQFAPDATPPAIGALFRQLQLAESLKAIALNGPREFYEGTLARRIVDGLAHAGSALAVEDLKATQTREAAPVSIGYRGVRLFAPPPPTQGLTTLAIMGVLARLPLERVVEGSTLDFHFLVEAVKQAFLDRGAIADPDFTPDPTARLLDPARLNAKAAAINEDRALAWPHEANSADTVFLSVIDREGRAVSLLQSIYFDWGSGVVAGDTGILWQNRGAAFHADPAHPNAAAPGKRPFYTLTPGLALKDGAPCFTFGTQGADGQPQTLAVLLTRLIDHGLGPEVALARPRFLLGRTFSDSADSLKIETHAGAGVLAALARIGHQVAPIPALSPLAGQAGVLARDKDGNLSGAHDPRSDGCALALDA